MHGLIVKAMTKIRVLPCLYDNREQIHHMTNTQEMFP